MYVKDQNPFINTAVFGVYPGSPWELLAQVNEVEALFGRERSKEQRWGERSLDIDILLFGNLVISTPTLAIPHSRLEERRFALEPLLELWPEARSPLTNVSYRQICDSLPEGAILCVKTWC
jgi:2-amino-4-hydroxy-6-hydroxymethyldihydropteridine diphosphokinase